MSPADDAALPDYDRTAETLGNGNLYGFFRRHFPDDPERVFIEAPERGSAARYRYRDLDAASARVAHALHAAGVEPGDRVLVQVDKSPAALFLYFGCLRAGAVYVPLNTAYTLAELDYFIGDAQPRVVVCREPDRDAVAGLAGRHRVGDVLTLDAGGDGGTLNERLAGQPDGFDDAPRAPDDLASMLYTSGTTGRSKGAMLTQRNLAANAATLVGCWRFSADDVLLHALPVFHTHGLFVATHCSLLSGGRMLLLPRFDADRVVDLLPRATVMMGVPTFYTRLLAPRDGRAPFDADRCRNMRLFISGSAPLSAETHREFSARTGHAILERYGMTETGMLTSNPYDGERRPGSVGPALPDVSLRVCDPERGHPLPAGEIGMIEVAGPNVFRGYWRMPEKTAEEFRDDGYFVTGDLGYIDDQRYVTIVGRGKDLIISGGFNVYPKEIEAALEALPGIAEAAVIGLPHVDFGEAVTAVVVVRPDAGSPDGEPDEAALQARLATQLAKFKVPKRILAVADLPRNAMGKVQKNQLRERYATLYRD